MVKPGARTSAESALHVDVQQDGPIALAASFTCPAGELLALVGPSGSGKTTLLRTIAGLYRPQTGSVHCANQVWLDSATGTCLTPQDRSVGLVFQDYALFPNLSVRGNVQAALGHLPKAQQAARIQELLALVNLTGLEHRRPRTLSGGQQQRVAIARALARDPLVLLLDEPFSAVDQVTRRKLREELAQLRGNVQIPIVLVTHDLEEAAMLADRLTILHHGQTLQHGPPQQVFTQPNSVQVARLVDLPNVFDATVIAHDTDDKTTRLDWQGIEINAQLQPQFVANSTVSWVIPGSGIILHRRDRPSRGERENPVHGTISNLVVLGDMSSVTLTINNDAHSAVSLLVPTHVAQRNTLAIGVQASVSLRAEAIHLMAAESEQESLSRLQTDH